MPLFVLFTLTVPIAPSRPSLAYFLAFSVTGVLV